MNLLKNEDLPEDVQRRINLSGLFYPLDRNNSRRWGTVLKNGYDSWEKKLSELAEEHGYESKRWENSETIIWKDPQSKQVECMFQLITNPGSLPDVENIFKSIKQINPIFTYVFLHQKKDGNHCWDIFRMSKFSYLEHCNRIYTTK
jgi:hypothetical protein